jgi:vancomycin permeability regulator SanA
MRRFFIKAFWFCFISLLVIALSMLIINAYVKHSVENKILNKEEAILLNDADAIMVLGCLVINDTPSDMLQDRLDVGIDLYQNGASTSLLMSGDGGNAETDYDEVSAMSQYAIEKSVDRADILMDFNGFSTYESMFIAKEEFNIDKMIIVTQKYHLYRALYIANKLGIEAYGVSADLRNYQNQSQMNTREVVARCKDFIYCIFKPNAQKINVNLENFEQNICTFQKQCNTSSSSS